MQPRSSHAVFEAPVEESRALNEIVRRLVSVYHPEKIYLFGSVARGEAGPDSDYDLVVILPDGAPLSLQTEDLGYRALRRTGAAADILVWTRTDFERQLHLKASFPSTVVREGKLLYGGA